ncbi:MAG: peptide chain release factor N(5)-glutamine methyltransferase [Prevotella sp.]|nr:peptide chain release factor N(5)-glutamine methyltransferase [Bacteroides sp.]MCM1366442.1 peptide chain release factor N(5)-glutamine methyltransferase [Prevotella sp.]MCM1437078.1 peptide chain release factor N(5)-glutamine methyltransferase [Prevotella sp.]
MTIAELSRNVKSELAPLYGKGEADAMVRLAFHALYGWDTTGYLIRCDREASDYMQKQFEKLIRRLKMHEPIQYILGQAEFYGMQFKVEPGVLIPRPETAELVDMIVDANKDRKDLRVLDVGTGTGCIAISLALNLPFSDVTAIDINPKAVSLAKRNAKSLHATITAEEGDIMKLKPKSDSYDIIVSNPPYITEKEKSGMERNVLEHEPWNALFVPDSNPLCFYRRIAEYAWNALSEGGRLYFEINPLYSEALSTEMTEMGWRDINFEKDSYNRVRFISSVKRLFNNKT